jgi:hypothetical protein
MGAASTKLHQIFGPYYLLTCAHTLKTCAETNGDSADGEKNEADSSSPDVEQGRVRTEFRL